MKIDFLVRSIPPSVEAIGVLTLRISQELQRKGACVRIFSSFGLGRDREENGVQVFPCITRWDAQGVVQAIRRSAGTLPDIVCLHYVPQSFDRWGMAWHIPGLLQALKGTFSVKVCVVFHEFISTWGIDPQRLLLASATRFITKRMLQSTDCFITTCGRYRRSLLNLAHRDMPCAVIPVSATIESTPASSNKSSALKLRFFSPEARVIGFLGRMTPAHNFPMVLELLKMARGQGIDARLCCMGDNAFSKKSFVNDMMQLAERLKMREYIVVTGRLPVEEMSAYLNLVDVFVAPQIDGISLRSTSLMSALAHGLPIVGFEPVPGNYDSFVIPRSKLIARGNKNLFLEAGIEFLRKGAELREESEANRLFYEKNFSWPIAAEKYLQLLGA